LTHNKTTTKKNEANDKKTKEKVKGGKKNMKDKINLPTAKKKKRLENALLSSPYIAIGWHFPRGRRMHTRRLHAIANIASQKQNYTVAQRGSQCQTLL
jgi:hypothetical protein